jgi:hypothetical protein
VGPGLAKEGQQIIAQNRLRLQVIPSLLETPSHVNTPESTRVLRFLLTLPVMDNTMFHEFLRRNDWLELDAIQTAWLRDAPDLTEVHMRKSTADGQS